MNYSLALKNGLQNLLKHNDFLIAFGVIGVVVIMLIPLPQWILDLLLSFSISLSIVILLVAMYSERATDFSVFPGLLLIVTLFRLSLNVASTRLILAEGDAGVVINAFGTFVTKGNAVVGFIIFVILVIIQFVVITKGATRIAEVAARFTLDAMPGKQMAIDADLNSGLITEPEARQRREDIRQEADFYGAMDGASKFVRGDVVASLIITIVNIVGGFIIGMVQRDLSFVDAISTYTRLTIGEGLVAQTPALLISTSAGIIVARAASKNNLGDEVVSQLIQSPKSLAVASIIMGLFAIVPGLPTIPFLVLSGVAGTLAYASNKIDLPYAVKKRPKAGAPSSAPAPTPVEEKPEDYLHVDQMEMEIGYGLIPLVDKSQGGDLLERISMIRRQIASEAGFIVPPIRIRDNIQLKPNEYRIKIKSIQTGGGELMSGCYLAMNPGNATREVKGITTKEPAFGLPALWITASQKEAAEMAGYTVVELTAVIATHVTEIIKSNAHTLLTRQDVKALVDNLKEKTPTVVEELVPGKLSIGELQKILQNLLREKVSVRDLATILEIIGDHIASTRDQDVLTEYVRNGLARPICDQYKNAENTISVISLDPKLEQLLEVSVQRTENGISLTLRPEMLSRLLERTAAQVEAAAAAGETPIFLCSPLVRAQFKKIIENHHPQAVVLSYNEIVPRLNIKSLGMVSLEPAPANERA
jgi:flagellar biosynthesis protein FlhA